MPRFSIIVPVYNTEEYLEKCLDSIVNQSYDDYEVIIVNDGSLDNSEQIIKKYEKKYKKITSIYKENGGLSSARNTGVIKSCGDYILFLDSDDYYSLDLLENLSLTISDDVDIIRFQVQDVFSDGNIIRYSEKCFSKLNGVSSFNALCSLHYVEVAWAYCFKRSFWLQHNFKFALGAYHEDFGLIPLVLINSSCSKCIDYIGYNYFQRVGSIMNNNDYSKTLKKAYDFLGHFKFLKEESKKVSGDLSIFNSYIANSVILKSTTLKGNDYKEYVRELKKNGAFDMLLDNTFFRKIKKILIRVSPKIYYKIVRG